jgi:hypothetical protein
MSETDIMTPLGYQILEHWRRYRPRITFRLLRLPIGTIREIREGLKANFRAAVRQQRPPLIRFLLGRKDGA